MAAPDEEFYDGFDKYGPPGLGLVIGDVAGEYNFVNGAAPVIITGLVNGEGYAVRLENNGGTHGELRRTLTGNRARAVGGVTMRTFQGSANQYAGVAFFDGTTVQAVISIRQDGKIYVHRGPITTQLAVSTETVVSQSINCLEWDITFSNTAGKVKVWLNGVLTSINLTGLDTCSTANEYINGVAPWVFGNFTQDADYDHFYNWFYTAAGGTETPALTNPIIETQYPASDDTSDFTFGAAILGEGYRKTTTTGTPAANSLVLRKMTAEEVASLDSISIVPGASSATQKFKPVVYADNGSGTAPAALLSTGAEVVGGTSGVTLTLPLTTPQATVAGGIYWIGYITDVAIALRLHDTAATGYRAANTYASGAPNPAPAMTGGQATWLLWGNLSASTTNYTAVNANKTLGDLSYNYSATSGHRDRFGFTAMATTPNTIYGAALKANVSRTDAGARTVEIEMVSGGVLSSGAAVSPPTSYSFISAYYRNDPNTGVAWTPTALNAALGGLKIAS